LATAHQITILVHEKIFFYPKNTNFL